MNSSLCPGLQSHPYLHSAASALALLSMCHLVSSPGWVSPLPAAAEASTLPGGVWVQQGLDPRRQGVGWSG